MDGAKSFAHLEMSAVGMDVALGCGFPADANELSDAVSRQAGT
jgi:hypothetical protein